MRFEPCHHHGAVGPMAGVISASMPVYVVEDRAHGHRAFSTLNEGCGKVLRYGAFAPEVLDRLRWMRDVARARPGRRDRATTGGIDLRALIAQAAAHGRRVPQPQRARPPLLLVKALAPAIAEAAPCAAGERRRVLTFASGNNHFFLNLAMAACKADGRRRPRRRGEHESSPPWRATAPTSASA